MCWSKAPGASTTTTAPGSSLAAVTIVHIEKKTADSARRRKLDRRIAKRQQERERWTNLSPQEREPEFADARHELQDASLGTKVPPLGNCNRRGAGIRNELLAARSDSRLPAMEAGGGPSPRSLLP